MCEICETVSSSLPENLSIRKNLKKIKHLQISSMISKLSLLVTSCSAPATWALSLLAYVFSWLSVCLNFNLQFKYYCWVATGLV